MIWSKLNSLQSIRNVLEFRRDLMTV
uniref:Uncharacterized protein n=1 Tax=Arundo donax TaxID=35708 RepID=A0A0A8ZI74_ARUDO